jgi:hypothetical protein
MYRQITLAGLLSPEKVTPEMRTRAYGDVRAAWREYLRKFNRGRGVVLVSHSQGTFVLRQLIRDEIDKSAAKRRQLVSALLLGGNVTVAKGKTVGGDFKNVAACTSENHTGCVVAYSMFNAVPPADSRFGRPVEADRDKLEVLCTNPAALGGGSGRLVSYVPTERFPGILGGFVENAVKLPAVKTPWLGYDRAAKARCVRNAGASYLQVDTVTASAPELTPQPDPGWGLHLGDVNLAFGNLSELVKRQTAAYLARGS